MQEKYARSIYRMNRETMGGVDEEVEDNSKALEDRRETHKENKKDRSLSFIIARIPWHHTVGTGRGSYVEYEVELEIVGSGGGECGEVWRLARRFRQFRDLHRRMSTSRRFGKTISKLSFPNRKIFFSLSSSVSSSRQNDLQSYLTSMLATCFISTKEELERLDTFFRTS